MVTIDDVRAAAQKARAWRPDRRRFCPKSSSVYMDGWGCGCAACLGANRAVEDIATHLNAAMRYVEAELDEAGSLLAVPGVGDGLMMAASLSVSAARISSYFASEPNPVSECRDAVRAFVEAGK